MQSSKNQHRRWISNQILTQFEYILCITAKFRAHHQQAALASSVLWFNWCLPTPLGSYITVGENLLVMRQQLHQSAVGTLANLKEVPMNKNGKLNL